MGGGEHKLCVILTLSKPIAHSLSILRVQSGLETGAPAQTCDQSRAVCLNISGFCLYWIYSREKKGKKHAGCYSGFELLFEPHFHTTTTVLPMYSSLAHRYSCLRNKVIHPESTSSDQSESTMLRRNTTRTCQIIRNQCFCDFVLVTSRGNYSAHLIGHHCVLWVVRFCRCQ